MDRVKHGEAEQIDTESSMGVAMFTILGSLA